MGVSAGLIFSLIFLAVMIYVVVKGLMIVQQSEVVVIERLGSYSRTLESGIHIIIPFLDIPRGIKMVRYEKDGGQFRAVQSLEKRIDIRESVLDFPGQPVVTSDNVTVQIDGVLYFEIVSPRDAVYKIENVSQAVEVLAKTTLRSVVGQLELDKLFESRDEVNDKIQSSMLEPASKWGVSVNRVEIQDIVMPREVEDAMRLQMTAERRRRAVVTEADGERESQIMVAEGEKRSAILTAEGDKEAAILRAQGEKESINLVLESLGEGEKSQKMVIGYLLGQSYIKQLPNIAKDGERVLVPFESSALIGSLSAFQDLTGSSEEMARSALRGGVVGSTASG